MDFMGPTTTITSPIGSDILDIGSRKALAKRQRGMKAELGVPGQFDVPNVANVSLYRIYRNSTRECFMSAWIHILMNGILRLMIKGFLRL